MATFVNIAQIVVAVMLIVMIMLEVRGSNLGGFVGGSDTPIYRTRRGFERVLFNLTIVVAILFFALSIWNVILTNQAAG